MLSLKKRPRPGLALGLAAAHAPIAQFQEIMSGCLDGKARAENPRPSVMKKNGTCSTHVISVKRTLALNDRPAYD